MNATARTASAVTRTSHALSRSTIGPAGHPHRQVPDRAHRHGEASRQRIVRETEDQQGDGEEGEPVTDHRGDLAAQEDTTHASALSPRAGGKVHGDLPREIGAKPRAL